MTTSRTWTHRWIGYTGVFALLALAAGCGADDTTAGDVERDMTEAANAAADFAAEERDAFLDTMQQRMRELEADIEALNARIEDAGEDAMDTTREQVDAMQAKAADARARLDELTDRLANATGDAWENMKDGMTTAVADLEQAYDDAMARMES